VCHNIDFAQPCGMGRGVGGLYGYWDFRVPFDSQGEISRLGMPLLGFSVGVPVFTEALLSKRPHYAHAIR